MIKAQIDKEVTLKELEPEEELWDSSTMEAIYQIRALKAIIHYGDSVLDFEDIKACDQGHIGFLHDFDIWVKVKNVQEVA